MLQKSKRKNNKTREWGEVGSGGTGEEREGCVCVCVWGGGYDNKPSRQ